MNTARLRITGRATGPELSGAFKSRRASRLSSPPFRFTKDRCRTFRRLTNLMDLFPPFVQNTWYISCDGSYVARDFDFYKNYEYKNNKKWIPRNTTRHEPVSTIFFFFWFYFRPYYTDDRLLTRVCNDIDIFRSSAFGTKRRRRNNVRWKLYSERRLAAAVVCDRVSTPLDLYSRNENFASVGYKTEIRKQINTLARRVHTSVDGVYCNTTRTELFRLHVAHVPLHDFRSW